VSHQPATIAVWNDETERWDFGFVEINGTLDKAGAILKDHYSNLDTLRALIALKHVYLLTENVARTLAVEDNIHLFATHRERQWSAKWLGTIMNHRLRGRLLYIFRPETGWTVVQKPDIPYILVEITITDELIDLNRKAF
jgi:hypothetical protein